MRIIEKTQQIEIWDFFMNDQNIMIGYTLPIKKTRKVEFFNKLILILAKILRGLLSNKNGICIFEKS